MIKTPSTRPSSANSSLKGSRNNSKSKKLSKSGKIRPIKLRPSFIRIGIYVHINIRFN